MCGWFTCISTITQSSEGPCLQMVSCILGQTRTMVIWTNLKILYLLVKARTRDLDPIQRYWSSYPHLTPQSHGHGTHYSHVIDRLEEVEVVELNLKADFVLKRQNENRRGCLRYCYRIHARLKQLSLSVCQVIVKNKDLRREGEREKFDSSFSSFSSRPDLHPFRLILGMVKDYYYTS